MQPLVESRFASDQTVGVSKVDFTKLSLTEIVETSRYGELRAGLKKSFKTDLHTHLEGAIPLEFVAKYSTSQEYDELIGFIEKLRSGMDYSEGFKAFPMIAKVLNSNKRIEEAAYEFCRSQHNDNVIFTELRTGLKRLDGSFEDYLKAVIAGLERGMKDYPLRVTLVLSLQRATSFDDANEIIDLAIKYRGQLITGIDVSGESTKGDCSGIFVPLQRAKSSGLPITLHIGENSLESPAQQLKELVEIQPDRAGHVVFGKEARDWIVSRQIVIEACIRSALALA